MMRPERGQPLRLRSAGSRLHPLSRLKLQFGFVKISGLKLFGRGGSFILLIPHYHSMMRSIGLLSKTQRTAVLPIRLIIWVSETDFWTVFTSYSTWRVASCTVPTGFSSDTEAEEAKAWCRCGGRGRTPWRRLSCLSSEPVRLAARCQTSMSTPPDPRCLRWYVRVVVDFTTVDLASRLSYRFTFTAPTEQQPKATNHTVAAINSWPLISTPQE